MVGRRDTDVFALLRTYMLPRLDARDAKLRLRAAHSLARTEDRVRGRKMCVCEETEG